MGVSAGVSYDLDLLVHAEDLVIKRYGVYSTVHFAPVYSEGF